MSGAGPVGNKRAVKIGHKKMTGIEGHIDFVFVGLPNQVYGSATEM